MSAWVPVEKAPAGREGILNLDLGDGLSCYAFGEWRVVDGVEGWFDADGAQLSNPTHWMPLPAPPTTGRG